jgi:putative glycosyltransferase (TIGR04348 family)
LYDALWRVAILLTGYHSAMKIFIACPAPPRSRKGNRVTALRWARILKSLGHRVIVGMQYGGQHADALVALHARRSHASIRAFRRIHPQGRVILALTGTDVYRDIHRSPRARSSLEMADRLVVLQPCAGDELPAPIREKVRVIYQSTMRTPARSTEQRRYFQVAVIGHLRPVKDPFRTALALRLLPDRSRLKVVQIGEALDPNMAARAHALSKLDHRYVWRGELPRWKTRRILASSKLLVLSSWMEGGANVISEAVVDRVPVLASRIAGSVGLLGEDYPGYFPVGDTRALANLMGRVETDAPFYAELRKACREVEPQFRPERERESWLRLLREL